MYVVILIISVDIKWLVDGHPNGNIFVFDTTEI